MNEPIIVIILRANEAADEFEAQMLKVSEMCASKRSASEILGDLDADGWPKRWSDPTYLGDGPWGA